VIAFIERGEEEVEALADPIQALDAWMTGYWAWLRSPVFPAMHRLVNSEFHNFPDIAAFYAKEVIERAHRLVCGLLARAMDAGALRRMDPLVAARMLSALFVTHALWYHQRTSMKSLAQTPVDVIFAQLRDFFLHAMRPDAPAVSSHA
ncbi:MAG TPA: TetR/AcrR family transcriptional regulator C-terminal domain-containing protein, partial [Gemmatimonadaceae bacterium]|nr:TetR/AcrR family transcriptional regulator C-terminal domain-containing protein [Gemmatimonadaceae bacterium]